MQLRQGLAHRDACVEGANEILPQRLSKTMPLTAAIHEGGRLRLRPILVTSLPTVVALAPVFFTAGLGAELQRPLALAVIGGLAVGTLASLYLTPVLYVALKNRL